MKKTFILLTLLLANSTIHAANFQFELDNCTYRGQFDNTKISEKQLRDTLQMFRYAPVDTVSSRHYAPQYVKQEFDLKIKKLNDYQILNKPVYQNAKNQLLQETLFYRDLTLTQAIAREQNNPALLGQGLPENIVAQCKKQQNQVRNQDLQSMEFGASDKWHNCVMNFVQYSEKSVQKAQNAFKREFKNLKKTACETDYF